MKISCKLYLYTLLLFAMLSSCSHSYYSPSDNILINLKEKNEVKVVGTLVPKPNIMKPSPREKALTGSLQIGYSPIKHFSVVGSYFNLSEEYVRPANGSKTFNNWNLALGVYHFFDFIEIAKKNNRLESSSKKLSKTNGLLLNLYVGYGQGNASNTYVYKGTSSLKFEKYFAQIGLHYLIKNFELGGSINHAILNYYKGKTIQVFEPELSNIESIFFNNPFYPMTANFKIATGYRNLKLYLNINKVIIPNTRFGTQDPLATIGLQANFGALIKKLKH